jgi:hypothetical protein
MTLPSTVPNVAGPFLYQVALKKSSGGSFGETILYFLWHSNEPV